MPARINQLATQFETIIFKYYGARPSVEAYASEIVGQLDETAEKLDEYIQIDTAEVNIKDYIQNCAAKKKGCDRAPLMNYLAHGIDIIKICLANPMPLDQNAARNLKQELTQLLLDMQSLSVLPKVAQIQVTYNGMDVIINGCYGCTSGNIIQEKLGSALKLTPESICEYVSDIINAQQNPLLEQENDRLNKKLLSQLRAVEENARLNQAALPTQSQSYEALRLKPVGESKVMRKASVVSNQSRLAIKGGSVQQPPKLPVVSSYAGSMFQAFGDLFLDPDCQHSANNDTDSSKQQGFISLTDFL